MPTFIHLLQGSPQYYILKHTLKHDWEFNIHVPLFILMKTLLCPAVYAILAIPDLHLNPLHIVIGYQSTLILLALYLSSR
jgi:hypothetical protein